MSADNTPKKKPRYDVVVAQTIEQIREAQALRYQIFSEELGAELDTPVPLHDIDRYDDFCHHILVRDLEAQKVIGCTRILTSDKIDIAGGYYSESEFDLTQIHQINGRLIEVGRTCVHVDHRRGSVMTLLWSGLARFMVEHKYDYLMGCASIPLPDSSWLPLFDKLQQDYGADESMRVIPKRPLDKSVVAQDVKVDVPPLLKAYIRLGAKICGDPCWDPHFKVADVFIVVSIESLQKRYLKHFVNRAAQELNNNVMAA
ncbi:GNAT family N-acyltransferase [Candidatus Albibeggiatoa sp. nov. NOAA]|uniref:GNAT family N-acetyltransferase n=1 Tax=Candidatus Albibeggiatoa sp. nov. NOAA TaxID=3162724 RepID=UPI0032F3706B|nr:GNAT family N-acetyltransferase [Thiotrichaceae bacterium]